MQRFQLCKMCAQFFSQSPYAHPIFLVNLWEEKYHATVAITETHLFLGWLAEADESLRRIFEPCLSIETYDGGATCAIHLFKENGTYSDHDEKALVEQWHEYGVQYDKPINRQSLQDLADWTPKEIFDLYSGHLLRFTLADGSTFFGRLQTRNYSPSFPISPDHLIYLHDSNNYIAGASAETTVIGNITERDVNQLNALQYLNCSVLLFFDEHFDKGNAESLKKESQEFREKLWIPKHVSFESFHWVDMGRPQINLQVSFSRLSPQGKQFKPGNRMVYLRHPDFYELRESLVPDEMQ